MNILFRLVYYSLLLTLISYVHYNRPNATLLLTTLELVVMYLLCKTVLAFIARTTSNRNRAKLLNLHGIDIQTKLYLLARENRRVANLKLLDDLQATVENSHHHNRI